MTSTTTKSTQTGTSDSLNTSTAANTSNGAGKSAPWHAPELTKSPEFILDALRDTKAMLQSLAEREAKLKKELAEIYENGRLAHLVDDENSQKYNYQGVSVTLVSGRKKRTWDQAVQMELDRLQSETKKVEAKAEYARLYTEEQGPSYWKVTLQKEL